MEINIPTWFQSASVVFLALLLTALIAAGVAAIIVRIMRGPASVVESIARVQKYEIEVSGGLSWPTRITIVTALAWGGLTAYCYQNDVEFNIILLIFGGFLSCLALGWAITWKLNDRKARLNKVAYGIAAIIILWILQASALATTGGRTFPNFEDSRSPVIKVEGFLSEHWLGVLLSLVGLTVVFVGVALAWRGREPREISNHRSGGPCYQSRKRVPEDPIGS